MDTTHIEYTAEDLISHKLQRSDLLVAKPKFDQYGADLLAFMTVNKGAKFCRIQCKGRSLIKSNSSNVEVPERYVTDGFILFLFVNDGNEKETKLYCFFSGDILKKWTPKTSKDSDENYYRLSFSKSNFQKKLIKYTFSDKKTNEIKNVIKKSDVNIEFNQLTDLINKQRDLIKLERQKNEMEKLFNEIKHIDELKTSGEEKIKIMEECLNYAKRLLEKDKK